MPTIINSDTTGSREHNSADHGATKERDPREVPEPLIWRT